MMPKVCRPGTARRWDLPDIQGGPYPVTFRFRPLSHRGATRVQPGCSNIQALGTDHCYRGSLNFKPCKRIHKNGRPDGFNIHNRPRG